MLINLSNHPSTKWQEKQFTLANKNFGHIYDLDFPAVPPDYNRSQVIKMAKELLDQIMLIFNNNNNDLNVNAVHIQGEFTLVFNLITLLKEKNIICIASTSVRDVIEIGEKRIINFKFERFREY